MNDNEKLTDAVLEASYDKRKDFTIEGKLMVTITLAEYRELVEAKAKADQRKETESIWQLRAENQKMRDKIAELLKDDND
jgi:DNA-binding transcriptional MerR regulator